MSPEERLIELETRSAFQERTIAQLDEVVRELAARLARVEGRLSRLPETPGRPETGFAEGLED